MDPFANVPTLNAIAYSGPDRWAADIPDFDSWADGLAIQDAEPTFDQLANPEIDPHKRLSADRAMIRMPTRRLFVDYRANPDAYRHLSRLPKAGESLHGVISGKYALWDLVPAILERTGGTVGELHILTLGFSKANGADLCGLLDAGQVKRASLVCSHYFKGTSGPIYDAVVPELLARGQRVIAMRSHCKMLLIRMRGRGGARYVVESSANLRSCVNVEQFVMSCDVRLYNFHRRWIEAEILPKAKERARAA